MANKTLASSSKPKIRRTCLPIFFTMVFAHHPVFAKDWYTSARISVAETYTDNVGLTAPGTEQSDLITQITPGFTLRHDGLRLRTNIDYSLQTIIHAEDSNRNDVNHQLNANAAAELIDNFFFTDARASIFQQNISLLGAQPIDNTTSTENRTNVTTLTLSPYIRHNIGNFAQYEARYTTDYVRETSVLGNSRGDRINLQLNSGPSFRRVGWSLNYNQEKVDYTNISDTRSRDASATLRYALMPRLSIYGTYGYEKYNYLTTGPEPKGSFWDAGFNWRPTSRTNINASTGEHYFGKSHAFSMTHHTRHMIMQASYTEGITTSRSQFLGAVGRNFANEIDMVFRDSVPNPTERATLVDAWLNLLGLPRTAVETVGFFTNETFLEKRFQSLIGLKGVRNDVFLTLFTSSRNSQVSRNVTSVLFGNSDFAQSSNIKQHGVILSWDSRLSSRTVFNTSLGYTRDRFTDIDRQDNLTYFKAGLTRRLDSKTTASVDYRRQQRTSNRNDSEYRENAISVFFNRYF